MGELHLEIIVDRLKREFKVEAKSGKPQISYRETINTASEGVGKFIRQSGGRGQLRSRRDQARAQPPATRVAGEKGEEVVNEHRRRRDPQGIHQARHRKASWKPPTTAPSPATR
jgi:hypothetical protein